MDGNRIRAWKKFDIDIFKGELSDDDVIYLAKHFDNNLNFENETLIDILLKFDRHIGVPRDMEFYIKNNITNISGKKGGSLRTLDYWICRGYTEEESKLKVSEIQKENSPRSREYWIRKGYSEEESKLKVSEIQKENALKFHKKAKENGTSYKLTSWSFNFWMDKGYSKEDAVKIVSDLNKANAQKYIDKYTPEERKTHNPLCVEYWLNINKTIEDYEKYMDIRLKNESRYRSRLGDDFCVNLAYHFRGNDIRMCANEFGKYIPDYHYVKYDYVDLTLKVAVEFNGEYWHSSEEAKYHDKRKKEFIESLGFKYFVITDKDYLKDKINTIKQLKKDIYENCNKSK